VNGDSPASMLFQVGRLQSLEGGNCLLDLVTPQYCVFFDEGAAVLMGDCLAALPRVPKAG
jgi:hypothetical protein